MRLRSSKSKENRKKITRLNFQKLRVFIRKKSVFRRYCIQTVKDGIQIHVCNIINKSVNHSTQFISVKGKKNLRKSQAQFWEKLRKLRLRQNNDFLKKNVHYTNYVS